MPDPDRILLIQLRRIGDVLLATPAFRAVRRRFPAARIELLIEPAYTPLVHRNPHLDGLLAVPRRQSLTRNLAALADIRRRRYDLTIDFLGKPRTALWSRLSGARRRIGYDTPGRRWCYTERVSPGDPAAYTVRHKEALLAPIGAELDDESLDFPIEAGDRDAVARELAAAGHDDETPVAALAPGARRDDKRWPAERFAELADRLVDARGCRVLLVCGPGEEDDARRVRRHMRHPCIFTEERPPLPRVQALLERCRIFIGNDTGLRHMAVAAGLPTVAVFGQPRPSNWTPPDDPRHRSLACDPGCKAACRFPRCGRECLLGVTVDEAWQAVRAVWEQTEHRP